MVDRLIRIKLEATDSTYLGERKIDIFKNNEGEYFSKFTYMNENHEKVIEKNSLIASDVEEIVNMLSKIKIPAFPKPLDGCDGGYTELEIGGYSGKSHFRWWSCPPEGWEELDGLTQRLIDCVIIEKG